ncbi:MAG: ornithine carbamoyltransferase [Actinomycetota bacterium]
MTLRHLLSSADLSVAEQASLVDRARELKASRGVHPRPLEGRSVGVLFEKPSTRTRVSFEVALVELGAHPVALRGNELQLGRGETVEDTARVFSRYLHGLVVRTFGQDRLAALASASSVPVVNALTDLEHPCQALADILTIAERFDDLARVDVAYLGDGNNVCHSLLLAGALAGLHSITVASPPGYEPEEAIVERAAAIGGETGTRIRVTEAPGDASASAHVLYTDVWASMGQEAERQARLEAFQGYQVSSARLADADPSAIVLHCLPAHRGEEIATEVIDGPSSAVWDQAENRLHAQKALLEWLLGAQPGDKP